MWRFIGGQDLLRADHDLESPRARAALCQFRYQVRSYFLCCRWVLATPMLGDLVTSADPDPVVAQDVIDEAGKRGGARWLTGEAAMQSDGHHLRRLRALAVERVEIVAQRDEEILGLQPRPRARRVSLSSSVCGMMRCGRP